MTTTTTTTRTASELSGTDKARVIRTARPSRYPWNTRRIRAEHSGIEESTDEKKREEFEANLYAVPQGGTMLHVRV